MIQFPGFDENIRKEFSEDCFDIDTVHIV